MSKPGNNQVAIIDYGMGNLFNIQRACSFVGLRGIITADKDMIEKSEGLLLPGVGAFGDAMNSLRKLDLIGIINDQISIHKPFLGICLGMQLLFSESEEFGEHKGLGIIKGRVVRFRNQNKEGGVIKVPQVGWNQVFFKKKEELAEGMKNGEYMYFVHSYYALVKDPEVVLTTTRYEDTEYCSSISKGSILAMQFHPEKSGIAGLKIYFNWARHINKRKELISQ